MSASATLNPYLPAVMQSELNYITPFGTTLFVDGTNGSDTNNGSSWGAAFATIQAAVTAASAGDTVAIAAKTITAGSTDPTNYAETITIPVAKSNLTLLGVSRGRTQGGLPQIKIGSGAVALLTIRAPGCLIKNIGFNGGGATGGGILLDDDSSTKVAFGTTIEGCHFKNCVGSSAAASAGGAITWAQTSEGGAWQVLIKGNRFYKNVADIVIKGSSGIQDVVIEDNVFSGPAASVDANIWATTVAPSGLIIRNNTFGQLPSGGSINRYIILPSGTVGMMVGCTFGCQVNVTGGTRLTFSPTGSAAYIPTTVHVADCWAQSIDKDESAMVTVEA